MALNGSVAMASELQVEANRQDAHQSTGPKTEQGIEAARFNALRHGLRSLQTVIPGEDPGAWDAHRASVVGDQSRREKAR
jgi:hypothetical protein